MNKKLQLSLAMFFTLLVASLGYAKEQGADQQPADKTDAIINGAVASVSTYPFIAFLADADGEQYCGASLISETWVLTAAHCFVNEAGDQVDIETGAQSSVVLNSDTVAPLGSEAEQGQIGQIIVHPNYNPDPATSDNIEDYDIALVELTAAVSFQPVKLLQANASTIAAGTEAIIMGWGTTAVDEENQSINPSNDLLSASQQIISSEDCVAVYTTGITDNMLCAGAVEAQGTTDTCQGDSGGPLVIASGNDFVQVGIVSFGGTETGPACGDPDAPGVYAYVSALADFISEHASDAQFIALDTGSSTPPSSSAPVLGVEVSGTQVTISWTAVTGATSYRLYYAPYPDQAPIAFVDMGALLSISGELPSGSAFFVAIEAYDENGALPDISNVEVFSIP